MLSSLGLLAWLGVWLWEIHKALGWPGNPPRR